MKRLYSESFYKPDLEAARAALDAHIEYNRETTGRWPDEPFFNAIKQKLTAQPQWPTKLLLDEDEVAAILNGIAIMDAAGKVRLHGPNGDPGEKFNHLQDRLMHDIGERK